MIRFADEIMREDVRCLWHDCFGDSNQYVDFFLDHFDISRHMLVFIDGEKPVSMLSLLPMSVVTRDNMTMRGQYIYAVATDPRYRARGLSTKLLGYAHDYLQKNGVHLSVLAPAKGSLYNFYHKRGFESEFFIGNTVVNGADVPVYDGSFSISEATPEEFAAIREKAFSGSTMFVRWDGDALAYRMSETAMMGGETLMLSDMQGQRAIAVCSNDGDSVHVRELALDGMKLEDAISILHRKYEVGEICLRLPMNAQCPFPLERSPLAMAYWYDNTYRDMVRNGKGHEPYMNLVLD